MAWVYILCGENGRHYIGSTVDLDRRLVEHRGGKTYTTRRLGSGLRLIASREYPFLADARRIERILKAKKNPELAVWTLLNR